MPKDEPKDIKGKNIKDPGKEERPKIRPLSAARAKKPAVKELQPVEELAAEFKVKPWELAGLMRAARWSSGKQVARAAFVGALSRFRDRRQGGGRI
jgi:hypothetical protein